MDTIFLTTQCLVLYSRQQTPPHGSPVPCSRSLLNLIFRWFPATKCSLALALFLCWELNLSRFFQLINPWVTAAAWMTDQGSAQGWTCHEGEMELQLKARDWCLDSVVRQHFLFGHFYLVVKEKLKYQDVRKRKGGRGGLGYIIHRPCVSGRKEWHLWLSTAGVTWPRIMHHGLVAEKYNSFQ